MRTLTTPLAVAAALATCASAAPLVLSACQECKGRTDCPSGQLCSFEGVCVPGEDPDGNGNNNNNNNNNKNDAGVPPVRQAVDAIATAPITMLIDDPVSTDPNDLLVTLYNPAASFDEVRSFDRTTGAFGSTAFIDQTELVQPCNVDTYTLLGAARIGYTADETWLSCRAGAAHTFSFRGTAAPTQSFSNTFVGSRSELVTVINTAADNDVAAPKRLLLADRGGSALRFVQLDASDGDRDQTMAPGTERPEDPASPLLFGAIISMFPVATEDDLVGSVVYVHDRVANQLVPVQRAPSTDQWRATSAAQPGTNNSLIVPLALPQGTAWVVFRTSVGVADPQTYVVDNAARDVPNLISYQPVDERVRFARLEVLAQEGVTAWDAFRELDLLTFEQDALPPVDNRVLVSEEIGAVNDASYMFFSTAAREGWVIPVPAAQNDDRNEEIKFADFSAAPSGLPTAFVQVQTGASAWVAFDDNGPSNQLRLVEFDADLR